MQTLNYTVGRWLAEAQLEELEPGKSLAVISVRDGGCNNASASRHTVVFEHQQGKDRKDETEALVRRLLRERYGML